MGGGCGLVASEPGFAAGEPGLNLASHTFKPLTPPTHSVMTVGTEPASFSD